MSLRKYFHEVKHEYLKTEVLSDSFFQLAGKKSGLDRWKEFFLGETMLLQLKFLHEELQRIWMNRR